MLGYSSSFAAMADFVGHWKNNDNNTRGITDIEIRPVGRFVRVRVWGQCHPRNCDWGVVKGTLFAPSVNSSIRRTASTVMAVFKNRFREKTVILNVHNNRMRAEVYTRFTDRSRRSHYTQVYRMRRTSRHRQGHRHGNNTKEDCIPFNSQRARVEKINNRWKITVNTMYLMDFGPHRRQARRSLNIIKDLQMNKQCFVGRPKPSFEYFLSANRAPRGDSRREDCVSFNAHRASVKRINGRWKIVDGSHMLFDFGNKGDEARQSLRIIKKYRFSQSCFVGRPNASMKYLKH